MEQALLTEELSIFYPDFSELGLGTVLYLFRTVILSLLEVKQQFYLSEASPEQFQMVLHLLDLSEEVVGFANQFDLLSYRPYLR